MENQTQSYIEIKLSPKGKYYWSIKLDFDGEKTVLRNKDSKTNTDMIANKIAEIDQALKDKFPSNSTLYSTNSSKFEELGF